MHYSVISILILIRLIYQVAGQAPPDNPPATPTTAATPNTPNSTTGTPITTPSPSSPTPTTSPSSPSGPSGPPNGSGTPSGSGTGANNLSCIQNFLQLCEAYQFQFNKVSEEYGCTMFTNPYLFAFHTNLVEASMECDTVMQLEIMRQNVMTNKGQAGPSTHAY